MITFNYKGTDVFFPDVGGVYKKSFEKSMFYEHPFLEYIASLNRGGTYLDVGCNLGNHALFFSKFTKCSHVIAFEPIPRFIEKIKETIRLNSCADKVTLIEAAASDSSGMFDLSFLGQTYLVKKIDIDSMELTGVSVIKIDVEGMEPSVILGARRTIIANKPLIFAEANGKDEKDKLFDALEGLEYLPTGKVFNASPTYEFIHKSLIPEHS